MTVRPRGVWGANILLTRALAQLPESKKQAELIRVLINEDVSSIFHPFPNEHYLKI